MENKWDVLMKNDYPQNEHYIYIRRRGGGGVADDLMSIDLLITLTRSKELLFSHSSYRNWPIFHYSHDQVNTIICRVCR